MQYQVNFLAVIVSAVAMMVLGFLWYGPFFGKQWAKLMGWSKADMEKAKKKGMTKNYVIMALGALVMAYVFDHILLAFGSNSMTMALQGAFWTWLGFYATVLLGKVLWEGKSWTLYVLDAGYYLVGLGIVALILTFWK